MGIVASLMASVRAAAHGVAGQPSELPAPLIERYPDLNRARWRRGGLPVRIGGWFLGRASVSAITLWHTVWVARDITPSAELLLHELRHVDQFEASPTFPLRYLWESVTRGYVRNRFEVDAREYAASRVQDPHRFNS